LQPQGRFSRRGAKRVFAAGKGRARFDRLACSKIHPRIGFDRAKNRRSDDQRIMEKYKFGLDGGEDSILVAAISAP
jgi:hypothetical protein